MEKCTLDGTIFTRKMVGFFNFEKKLELQNFQKNEKTFLLISYIRRKVLTKENKIVSGFNKLNGIIMGDFETLQLP